MVTIRNERTGDIDKIKSMYAKLNHYCLSEKMNRASNTLQLIEKLRSSGELSLSLVAVLDGNIVGHIAFSPIKINGQDSQWVGLGPVNVDPAHHNQGIATKLINDGLDRLRLLKYGGVVVLDQRDFFERFGFNNKPDLELNATGDKQCYAVSLNATAPKGKVSLHPALEHFVGRKVSH